jgi:hypothetical protein
MSQAIADQLFLSYMGRAADTQWRSNTTTLITAQGGNPTKALKDAFFTAGVAEGVYATTDSPSTLVNKFFLNTFGFAARTDEQTFWGNLVANGTYSAGELVWQMFSSYANNTTVLPTTYVVPMQSKLVALAAFSNALTDPTINAAYSQINSTSAAAGRTYLSAVTSQATAATAITGVAATVASVSVASGSTFTLTTGIDNITGTGASDTFNASADQAAGSNSISSSDIVNGGAGTDTLSIRVADMMASTAHVVTPQISAIEVLTIDNDESTAKEHFTLSLGGASGVTTINNSGSVAGSQSAVVGVTASAVIGLTNTKGQMAVDFASTVFATTSDAITVNLNGAGDTATSGAAAVLWLDGSYSANTAVGTSDNTLETLTITSNTTASRVDMSGGSAVKTLNISGDASLTLTDGEDSFAAVTTVNASTFTGALTINLSSSTANVAITTNTGNDRINMGAVSTNLTASDTLTLGTGTDTVAVSNTSFTADDITVIKAKLTSAEVLELTATIASATYSFSDVSVISAFTFSGTNVGTAGASGATGAANDGGNGGVTLTLTGAEAGDSITFSANTTGGAGGAAGTAGSGGVGAAAVVITPLVDGGSDSITITLTGGISVTGGAGGLGVGTGSTGGAAGNAITATSTEVVNIVSSGTTANTIAAGTLGAAADGTPGAAASSIVVNTNGTINVTGTRDINIGTIGGTNATVDASNFTGKLTVTGEAGNNTIKGGSAVDTIDAGAGIDTITGNGGADIINFKLGTGTTDSQSNIHNLGGTANSTADAGTLLSIDSITDYTKGSDLISITSSSAAAVTLAAANVTANATASAGVAAISAGGAATFVTADDTLVERAIATAMGIKVNTTTAGDFAYFELSGDTYLLVSDGTDGLTDGDLVIKLTGVTGVSSVSFSSGDVILS